MSDIINKEKVLEHAKKLVAEGRFDRATAEYEKLLQLDPDDLRIKIKIAELYVKRKQIQDAIRIYNEVAGAYSEGGFYLKAVTVLKNILRLNPSLIDINIALAELYEKMGLIQDALYQYQIVVTSYERKNDSDGMIRIREKMASLDPQNVELKIRLAEAYQLIGQEEKSMDMYEGLIESVKESGKNDLLIEIYGKVLSHRPDRLEYFRDLCKIIYRRGEWKDILKRMDAAKEFVSEDPELLAMQADVYSRLNQLESAKKKYRELAVLYVDHGRPEDAIDAYASILLISPENEADLSEEISAMYDGALDEVKAKVEEKRKKSADEDARREMELEKNAAEIEREADNKGGKVSSQSVRVASTAAADDFIKIEKDADSTYELAKMYEQTGLASEARAEYDKALALYRRLALNGRGSQRVVTRIEELSAEDSSRDRTAPKAPVQPQVQPKQTKPPPKKIEVKKPAVKKSPVAVPTEPKSEPKKTESLASAKKKISFV